MTQQLDYLSNKNSLFGRATKGSVVQAMTLQSLHKAVKTSFETSCVAVSDGNYVIALNVPWFWYYLNWFGIREIHKVTLAWLVCQDPGVKTLRIQRTAKGLEREQAALSWDRDE
jgi:hypothetical protein